MDEEIDVIKLAYKMGEMNADLNILWCQISKIDSKGDDVLEKQLHEIKQNIDGFNEMFNCDQFFHDIWKE